MDITIPSAEEIRASLERLTLVQIDRLGALSGVPAATIRKIRYGQTTNPGLDTVRQFMPHIEAARAEAA